MHTNPKKTPAARVPADVPETRPPQSQPAAPVKMKRCPGCGVHKGLNAFPQPKRGEPARAKVRCRRCVSHGGARLRDERARQKRLAENPGHKYCARCGLMKPHECFVRDARSADGHAAICKTCGRVKREELRAKAERAAARKARRLARDKRLTEGLIAAYNTCPTNHRRTRAELAAYCNCSEDVIRNIEEGALKKVLGPLTQLLHDADIHVREVRL